MLMMIRSLIEHTPGQTVAFVYVFLQSEQYVSEIGVIHSIFYLYGPAVLQRFFPSLGGKDVHVAYNTYFLH